MMPQGEWTEDGWKESEPIVVVPPAKLQQIQASEITKASSASWPVCAASRQYIFCQECVHSGLSCCLYLLAEQTQQREVLCRCSRF